MAEARRILNQHLLRNFQLIRVQIYLLDCTSPILEKKEKVCVCVCALAYIQSTIGWNLPFVWFVESPFDFLVLVIPWIVLQELDKIKDRRYRKIIRSKKQSSSGLWEEIIGCFRNLLLYSNGIWNLTRVNTEHYNLSLVQAFHNWCTFFIILELSINSVFIMQYIRCIFSILHFGICYAQVCNT